MCLQETKVTGLDRWNWDGDIILFDAVLPSGRPTVAAPHKPYAMDVREYVATENNAVIRHTLVKDVAAWMRRKKMSKALFTKRGKGAFDYRVHVLTNFVSQRIRYQARKGRDPWQYPEETLALGSGDCEDIAFVLTSLLLASGISPYNLRVALGSIVADTGGGQSTRFDHMWVMYKAESGLWHLLEPLHVGAAQDSQTAPGAGTSPVPAQVASIEYRPRFVFNGDHVWSMRSSDAYTSIQQLVYRDWKRINPKFAGFVHQSIINTALTGIAPPEMMNSLNRHFCFGWSRGVIPVVEDVDNFVTNGYDSRDHFDNGFIAESWQRVTGRLAAFRKNNTDFDSFALAAHGIADFYAHSSYGHFASIAGNAFALYDPANPSGIGSQPDYSAGSSFDLSASGLFEPNTKVFTGDRNSIPALWAGKLISGRYAQPGDAQSILEGPTTIPPDLLNSPDFWQRGSLPHHNTIAVDQPTREPQHRLYRDSSSASDDRMAYANQYAWRFQTAIAHIRKAYKDSVGA